MLDASLTRRRALQALAGSPIALASAAPDVQPLAFTHVTVIDGTGAVLKNHTVVMNGDRISAVGESGRVAELKSAVIADGRGRFLIPGLWDTHAHLSYTKASALPVLLANGVTRIHDMGGFLHELDEWRMQVDSGLRAGPRIVRAGPIVNGKKFNEFQIVVNDAAEARGAVRALQHSSVDFIKVHAAISRDAYIGVSEECKRLNFPFAGHIPRAVTPDEVSDRGQVSIEHVSAIGDRLARAGVAADKLADALADFRKQEAPA